MDEQEILWRQAVMAQQIPERGAIPFLTARPGNHPIGRCLACGDALPSGNSFCCAPCAEAARRLVWGIKNYQRPELARTPEEKRLW